MKCLHAHWAWHLAGGDDPVGRWIEGRLRSLVVELAPERTVIALGRGGRHAIPWGPDNLTGAWLADDDPPHPAALTNALGAIDDHLDDLEREHGPEGELRGAPTSVSGTTIAALARLELGLDVPPAEVVLTRDAAEEVFRLVATEPAADRSHNPGLPSRDVDRIIATCCIVLAVMRRLRLDQVTLRTGD